LVHGIHARMVGGYCVARGYGQIVVLLFIYEFVCLFL
jgi:hypothetical protein